MQIADKGDDHESPETDVEGLFSLACSLLATYFQITDTTCMTETEIQDHLKSLPGWEYKDNSIFKQFTFNNFLESVAFVNKVAPVAEEMGHHPDLKIEYSKVTVTLTTHDEGGPASPRGEVTQKDLDLASKIQLLP